MPEGEGRESKSSGETKPELPEASSKIPWHERLRGIEADGLSFEEALVYSPDDQELLELEALAQQLRKLPPSPPLNPQQRQVLEERIAKSILEQRYAGPIGLVRRGVDMVLRGIDIGVGFLVNYRNK